MLRKLGFLAGLVVFSLAFSIFPGTVGAEGFFSLFRKDQAESWAIDPSEFVKMLDAIEGRGQIVQIANFGEMEILTFPEAHPLTMGPRGQVDFQGRTLTIPVEVPGYSLVQARTVSASKIRFTLFTAPINRFLTSLSIRAVVPSAINRKPFTMHTAPLVAFIYPALGQLASDLIIAVTKPSELILPPSVNGESLQEALLAIPGLPRGLRSQFANVSYNGQVLITPDGLGETVRIRDGVQAAYTSGPKTVFKGLPSLSPEGEQYHMEIQKSFNQKNLINGLWGMRFWADSLIWLEEEYIYMVMGELTMEQAIKIAEMVR